MAEIKNKPFFRVHGERAVVRYFPKDSKTASGIIIPDNAVHEDKENHGVILCLGDENRDLKVGDEVIWAPFSAVNLDIKPYEHLKIIEYKHIYVTFPEK